MTDRTGILAAARAIADLAEPGDRNATITELAARADLQLVHAKSDFSPHLADPAAVITLCRQGIDRALDQEQASRISVLCPECGTAAQKIAATREAEAAERTAPVVAPRVHRFDSTIEAYNATQWNDEIRDGDVLVIASEKVVGFLNRAWPAALTDERGELHSLTAPVAEIDHGRYAESARVAADQARTLGLHLKAEHAPRQAPTAVHRFDSTAQVREAADDDRLADGDVFVVEAEGVAGFVVVVTPAVITENRGCLTALHRPARDYCEGAYSASADVAEREADALGLAVAAEHRAP
jgi:hypothetical protein